jgi:hypothetical protein
MQVIHLVSGRPRGEIPRVVNQTSVGTPGTPRRASLLRASYDVKTPRYSDGPERNRDSGARRAPRKC